MLRIPKDNTQWFRSAEARPDRDCDVVADMGHGYQTVGYIAHMDGFNVHIFDNGRKSEMFPEFWMHIPENNLRRTLKEEHE